MPEHLHTIDASTIIHNPALLEIARKAVEDELIKRRDARIAVMRRNGLVVFERDGSPSTVIRMGMEEAMVIGLHAILASLQQG